ncbi:MAG: cellulase family glycosylhydrolase [Candidatus Sedimenticola sp. (ex Thyasira tokunagai)]
MKRIASLLVGQIKVVIGLLSVLLLLFATYASGAATSWSFSVSEKDGLPHISSGGANALTTSFVFWGAKWKWAGFNSKFKVKEPFSYAITGSNKQLEFDLQGTAARTSADQLVWDFSLDAKSDKSGVIGGGLVFKFDLTKFSNKMGVPALLPNNSGWRWGKNNGPQIEVRFDPPVEALYFERGRKSELRAFFYKGQIKKGTRHYKVTLTTSSNVTITPTTTERFGLADIKKWPKASIDWRQSPVDLSFLNDPEKPAGKRGFLKAVGDKLVFEDGTQARFWGTNLSAYTLFKTPKSEIKLQAKRLSSLGFNLVRLHHHDSPWVNPNIFGDKKQVSDTQLLDKKALENIDWWIKCLKDEGIYIWLDLHVQRAFKPDDKIYGYEELGKGNKKGDLKGYSYVNLAIQQAMQQFNEAYVTHYNRYTGLQYKDDPVIAAVMITNENDITHHFGNALLPDKKVPKHSRHYMDEAKAFAKKHDFPEKKTWRSWEHGPSKLFLNDLEHRFNRKMIEHLRLIGVKVPIVTTSTWGRNPLSSLPALTDGDIIDVHSYGGLGELEKSPLIAPNMMHWIAAGQVAGKPLTVTEWNVSPFPTQDRHTAPLYMAAMAAYQGWDAVMLYAYAQIPLKGKGRPSNWHAYIDPALIATLPAAALLYRQQHVSEAETTYLLSPEKKDIFYNKLSPETSVAIRTATEQGKLLIRLPRVKALPWLNSDQSLPANAIVIDAPGRTFLRDKDVSVTSDTGELSRNWVDGIYTIDTPRTQALLGWIGGREIRLQVIQSQLITRNASIVVQSLDEKAIADSGHILVSASARSVPDSKNKLPFYSEPVEGVLKILAQKGMLLSSKSTSGEKTLPVVYQGGYYTIDLGHIMRGRSQVELIMEAERSIQ